MPKICEGTLTLEAILPDEALTGGIECAVITTDHRAFDYAEIAQRAPIVVDTRNALKGIEGDHIFRL